MVALTLRILTVALALYSFLQVRSNLTDNVSGALAAKVLFAIQILVGVIFFVIPFFPETVHFGSRRLADYTPAQLERIAPLLRDMLGLMGFLFVLYFAVNIHLLVGQSLSPDPREIARTIVAIDPWLVGALLVGEGATVFYYLRRFDSVTSSPKTLL